jgi:hypothetical protein
MAKFSHSKMKFSGNLSAIEALRLKLADLYDRKNEKERVRGFDDGGTAVDEEEQDLDAQIAQLENDMSKLEQEREELQAELEGVVDEMQGFSEFQDTQQSARDAGNVEDEMEKMADKYREYGIDCEVEINGEGRFEINVKTPGKFEGDNLLEMSAEDLMDLVDEIEEQQLAEEKMKEAEPEKGADKGRSKERAVANEDESKNKDGDKKKKPKPMELLPGDAVASEDEEEQKLLIGKKRADDKEKGDEKKKPKIAASEGDEKIDHFDHGLGRQSFVDRIKNPSRGG